MELAYDEHGARNGRTLFLLHGLTNSRHTYGEVVDRLTGEELHIVNPDLRGHGRSGRDDSYRVTDYASDVAQLFDRIGADSAVVIGHSLGGLVASELAATHPQRVEALFMEDPPLYQGDPVERATDPSITEMPALAEQLRAWHRDGVSLEEAAREYGDSPSVYADTTKRELLGEERLESRVEALLQCDPAAVDATFNGTLWEGFDPEAPISCPVRLLAADPSLDAMFLPRHFDGYIAAVPHAQIVAVDGAAHSIRLTDEGLTAYMDTLLNFLESL